MSKLSDRPAFFEVSVCLGSASSLIQTSPRRVQPHDVLRVHRAAGGGRGPAARRGRAGARAGGGPPVARASRRPARAALRRDARFQQTGDQGAAAAVRDVPCRARAGRRQSASRGGRHGGDAQTSHHAPARPEARARRKASKGCGLGDARGTAQGFDVFSALDAVGVAHRARPGRVPRDLHQRRAIRARREQSLGGHAGVDVRAGVQGDGQGAGERRRRRGARGQVHHPARLDVVRPRALASVL